MHDMYLPAFVGLAVSGATDWVCSPVLLLLKKEISSVSNLVSLYAL